MAIVSSHTLDAVNGTHAGNIEVELTRLDAGGGRTPVFVARTDEGGRLSQEVSLEDVWSEDRFELVFRTGAYFEQHPCRDLGARILDEVVIRFRMPRSQDRYHIPLMLSPNSYSVWWSE